MSLRETIDIALPKGRLGEQVYDMFERAGCGCPGIREDSRKLVFENPETGMRFFWVKPSDVAIYVERGAADMGVAGRDKMCIRDRSDPRPGPEVYGRRAGHRIPHPGPPRRGPQA